MHKKVERNLRSSDFLSAKILDKMIDDMLGDKDIRPTTKQLRDKATKILAYAKTAASKKRNQSPAPSLGTSDLDPHSQPAIKLLSAIPSNLGPSLATVDTVPSLTLPSRSKTLDSTVSTSDSTTGAFSMEPPTVPPTSFSADNVPTLSGILSQVYPSSGSREGPSNYKQQANGPVTALMSTFNATSGVVGSAKPAQNQSQIHVSKSKRKNPLPAITPSEVEAFYYKNKSKKTGPVTLKHDGYLEGLRNRDHVCSCSSYNRG